MLSWNEIKDNAIKFSKEWLDETREASEAQSFWNDFFTVFGIRRRTVASFEEPVRKLTGDLGAIDLFWPGMLLVEHKSRGKDLAKASSQAFKYIQALATEGRHKDIPRYVIVSDFFRIAIHDLEPEEQKDLPLFEGRRVHTTEFKLEDFHKNVHLFAFIPGYKQHRFEDQDPINLKAVEIMGNLHDALEAGGYKGHDLERFLVRILFCLFAEDTGLFERDSFHLYIVNSTKEDGTDLGPHLARLFEVLDTPVPERQKKLDETLASFPYVNGDLYKERLRFADFDRAMRDALLDATKFDWSRISPAVFGALFQAVMEPKERRQIGAHYTSERDILKVARGLFLDDLRSEYDNILTDKSTRKTERLKAFHDKISTLKFFDPACGCGNFLVITYRELRALEIDVLKELYGKQQVLDIHQLSKIDVDAFYGIEIEEWPSRIAEVAMWLMDHQMNIRLSEAFGHYYHRLPLRKSPTIVNGNALRLDWNTVLPAKDCSYILGNPPFVGQTFQSPAQKADQQFVLGEISANGVLDFVSNWYAKAAEYIQHTIIRCALVSTNSITQGEQAALLWNYLFQRYHLKIHFAHRTFTWVSEARGKAHVHVVIVGFGATDTPAKRLFDYHEDESRPTMTSPKNISPYLVEGPDRAVSNRSEPLCPVPKMSWGNKPTDGGFLIFDSAERKQLLSEEPDAKEFIRPYMGGGDFINGVERYCLWLKDADSSKLRRLPQVMARVEKVRQFRLESKAESTRAYAKCPTLFRQIAQPDTDYLAVPEVSSERRPYIPIAFVKKRVICSNTLQFVPDATPYHFGMLCSLMHMAWVKQVCGRLKSDYRYSNTLVYNNYPWPQEATEAQMTKVTNCALAVLEVRQPLLNAGQTLADIYDPLTMPPALQKAHEALDKAVDKCYRPEPFTSDRQRVEFLFQRYETLTAPLLPTTKAKRRKG